VFPWLLGGGGLLALLLLGGSKRTVPPVLAPTVSAKSVAAIPTSSDITWAVNYALANETGSGNLESFGNALVAYGDSAQGNQLLAKAAQIKGIVPQQGSSQPVASSEFTIAPGISYAKALGEIVQHYTGSSSLTSSNIDKAVSAALKDVVLKNVTTFYENLLGYGGYESLGDELEAHAEELEDEANPSSTAYKGAAYAAEIEGKPAETTTVVKEPEHTTTTTTHTTTEHITEPAHTTTKSASTEHVGATPLPEPPSVWINAVLGTTYKPGDAIPPDDLESAAAGALELGDAVFLRRFAESLSAYGLV
jgi:hypothetical protein